MRAARATCILLAALVFDPTPIAMAQTRRDDARARALFERGLAEAGAERWAEAVELFRRSREASERPGSTYNLAVALDHLDRVREAAEVLEAYFALAPADDSRRAQAEELRERLAGRLVHLPVEREVNLVAASPDARDPAPWIVLGSGGALVVAGACFLGVGAADVASVQAAPSGTPWRDVAPTIERATIFEGVGIGGLALGVVLAGAGLAWGIAGSGAVPSAAAERVQIAIGPGGLALEGEF